MEKSSEYESGRKQKQQYLWENVANLGYDTVEFA